VRNVADLIEGDFVVSMADIVCDLSIKKMQKFFYSTNAYATISLKNIDFPTKKFGVILLDEDQNIEIFLEKPKPEEMLFTTMAFAYRPVSEFHQNLVNTGIYFFKHQALEILDNFKDIVDFGQDMFPYLLQEKFKLNGFVDDYYWIDAGNVRSYLWANYDVLRGFVEDFSPPGKQKKGNWIGENVVIDESVEIMPPIIVGDNVIIGKDSKIGPLSVIHNDVKIKDNVTIERSVIWENSILNSHSFVQNSVICDNVEIEENRKIIKYSAIS
jgi:NDP-sugar pyrophosphorylase family protein